METIVSGSIEHFVVTLTDRRAALTDLDPLTPLYDVLDKDDNAMMANEAIDADGLTAYCLIDTSTGAGIGGLDPWPSGIYRLYIKFTAAPEVPIHGPFPFRVEER